MTTQLNDPQFGAGSRLNIFDDPTPWNQVRVAGLLVLALAVKFNGFKVEDTWKKQKPKEASGATFSFGGTDPVGGESGFSITFRVTTREEFDQLYDLYDALKPVPVAGGVGGGSPSTVVPSPGAKFVAGSPMSFDPEKALADAQAALSSLNSPKPAPSSEEAAAQASPPTPQPSPGPRPPTVPIELGWLAFLGVFAVARKSFEFSAIEQDKYEVTVGFVQDSPPKPAGSGAMAAPAPAVASADVVKSLQALAAGSAVGT